MTPETCSEVGLTLLPASSPAPSAWGGAGPAVSSPKQPSEVLPPLGVPSCRALLQPWSGLPVGLPHRHLDGRLERNGREKLSSGGS